MAANTNSAPMRVPTAVMMMLRKTLLMRGNARIAVSLPLYLSVSPLLSKHPPPSDHKICVKRVQCVFASSNLWETFLMRSKLAIFTLVVASLFGSTLIASAQTQTAPGASSQGTVNPGATSGKKTQHVKGMTSGSSTRSGANKSGTMTPSGQDSMGSGVDNMAAPKSGSK
jgi:hypothetical protein